MVNLQQGFLGLGGGSDSKVNFRAAHIIYRVSRTSGGFREVYLNQSYVKNGPDSIIYYGLLSSSGPFFLLNGVLFGHPKCLSSIGSLAQDLTASCVLSLLYNISFSD